MNNLDGEKLADSQDNSALFKKLVQILGTVGTVSKSGYNQHNKYYYMTEADLLDSIRGELAKRNIFVFTSVDSVERDKDTSITTVITNHTFWDAETGQQFTVQSAGQGADKQDKGVYKAITGSMKYFLMKNFLISAGDDPENEEAKSNAHINTNAAASKPAQTLTKLTQAETKETKTEVAATDAKPVTTANSFSQFRQRLSEQKK